MILLLGTIFAGLLGLAFGSFMNVCLSRWPEGESVVTPRSHCCHCGRTLTWWENVPLVSWLALRGRCRTCRAWIGWRYPLVELTVGVLWALSAWQGLHRFPDLTLQLNGSNPYIALILILGYMILSWVLVALAALDAEHLWLPDWITWPGILLGFIFSLLLFKFSLNTVLDRYNAWPLQQRLFFHFAFKAMLGIAAAAGLVLLIRWIYWLIRRREGIGLGDAKLMALVAAWLGFPCALLSFVLGVAMGALVAVVLLAVPAARENAESWGLNKLPLGTFICIGGIVSSLWGQHIIAAYLRWAGF
jgi:leader peptidase (prepilin peptidase)/N-methyltransferase